jgi:hypothetical protein|tara:strand:+ start:1562 stop:1933 length:372 start_codon:yes stop_codon:yes gene_type:complete
MDLNVNTLELFAAKNYKNVYCHSKEEFIEDLSRFKLAKKLAKKVNTDKTKNIRLLVNHIICFTNNFELQAAKRILIYFGTDEEKKVFKTILTYLSLLDTKEYSGISYCLLTAKLLKDMDNASR